jgi:hypothetical protein
MSCRQVAGYEDSWLEIVRSSKELWFRVGRRLSCRGNEDEAAAVLLQGRCAGSLIG